MRDNHFRESTASRFRSAEPSARDRRRVRGGRRSTLDVPPPRICPGPSTSASTSGYRPRATGVVTHYFSCLDPAYRGWCWAVTVMRAARAKLVTVGENVLLPGDGALLAPAWLPWNERLRPDDLGPGDLLPTDDDDIRLAPGYTQVGDDDGVDGQQLWELGLGRHRVLSLEGRDEAAERWTTATTARPPRSPGRPLRTVRPVGSWCRSPVDCASSSASAPTGSPPTTARSSPTTTAAAPIRRRSSPPRGRVQSAHGRRAEL